MPVDDPTLTLVQDALEELDRPEGRVSVATRKAIRVARLRNDWKAVYWLQLEMESFMDREARRRVLAEVAPYFSREELNRFHKQVIADSLSSRTAAVFELDNTVSTDKVCGLGVPELETVIESFATKAQGRSLPPNLHPVDAYFLLQEEKKRRSDAEFSVGELRKVLSRLSQRVYTYLSQVERHIRHGQLEADAFEQNRQYVDAQLKKVAPEVLDQLQAAYRRVREGDPEARSHALTSCRRALKSMADRLYPPRSAPVMGLDGKERVLTDAMFVARLWQFVADSKATRPSKELLIAEVKEIGDRVDRLNELSSKGVHAQVTEFEVNMCILGTYSVVGAILRLRDERSAALVDPAELAQ